MNFFLLFITLLAFASGLFAQVSKTVNLTEAGTLKTVMSVDELSTVTKLTITGNIDARDFETMRYATSRFMSVLIDIDLSDATIVAYTTYLANRIPNDAFSDCRILTTVILPTSVISEV